MLKVADEALHLVLQVLLLEYVSCFILILIVFHETIEDHGGMTILCRIPQTVATALSHSGLKTCFHLQETRGEAIWSF